MIKNNGFLKKSEKMIKNVKKCKILRISGVVRTFLTTQQKGRKLP